MKFSVRLNNDLEVDEYVAMARVAEAAGFDQFWVSHDLFWRSSAVILTAVALATERIEIGTCILNPYTQHPSEIAMLAASLDEVSGGTLQPGHLGRRGRVHALGRDRLRQTLDDDSRRDPGDQRGDDWRAGRGLGAGSPPAIW
jgi:alkanesulfonate monooxygenase SsuD/methylene tetrahydromethanopterin reductase-like flavin-dependent oxidoreductase (luciferase family)